MRTDFTPAQLADPQVAEADGIIRNCVHCGFCTATCPTYVLLGDELDSPRGRIMLIKNMLEGEQVPTAQVVKHIDRCLSCLACTTTCPSSVDYMHLVDGARAYIESRYRRPFAERMIRGLLATVLPHRNRFRAALVLAGLGRPLAPLFERVGQLRPLAAMLRLAPRRLPPATPWVPSTPGSRGRVALVQGCAEPVLRPGIQAATRRLLERCGYEVLLVQGEECCGALVHHLGRADAARQAARRNVDAWSRVAEDGGGLAAIVVTASGCGTMIKDYGHLLAEDAVYAGRAARLSALARDVSELVAEAGLPTPAPIRPVTVAYHAACSLQHGQNVRTQPVELLAAAGFLVRQPSEAHLCCGSAGTYNLLQPELAERLRDRKLAAIRKLSPDVIATGNIGCATQLASGTDVPVVHTVELLDWATGGPQPDGLCRPSTKGIE